MPLPEAECGPHEPIIIDGPFNLDEVEVQPARALVVLRASQAIPGTRHAQCCKTHEHAVKLATLSATALPFPALVYAGVALHSHMPPMSVEGYDLIILTALHLN
jgi:hypothetical protein